MRKNDALCSLQSHNFDVDRTVDYLLKKRNSQSVNTSPPHQTSHLHQEDKKCSEAIKEILKCEKIFKNVNEPNICIEYTLHSIIQHIGPDAHAGHYVVDINNNGKWKRYDDQFVHTLECDTALGKQSE